MKPIRRPISILRKYFVKVHACQHVCVISMVDGLLCEFRIIHFSMLWVDEISETWKLTLVKTWNLELTGHSFFFQLTLSAGFTILPRELGLSRRYTDLGLQVRNHHQAEALWGGWSAERQYFQLLFCYPWKLTLVAHGRLNDSPTTA